MKASIVVRTLNEERHLPALLESIASQEVGDIEVEVVVVDSGSTDRTVAIAERAHARVTHIEKEAFSFGRSLNVGCEHAEGDLLVFVSGHCIPVDNLWLAKLLQPLLDDIAVFSYGRQIGNDDSHFSERQLFSKYFPLHSQIPQVDSFFVNNANSALKREAWARHRFDEELTGLEDMELAKRLVAGGMKLAYVGDASVYHLHDETWGQIRRRYEREAIALQSIMPEVHINLTDFVRYYTSAVLLDLGAAVQERAPARTIPEILSFRLMQFWGSYRGNHEHRKLSRRRKEKYFYPK